MTVSLDHAVLALLALGVALLVAGSLRRRSRRGWLIAGLACVTVAVMGPVLLFAAMS